MRYLHLCTHEQFPPDQLLRQAVAAEDAGREEGERQTSDEDLKEALIIASDPEVHAERVREVEEMGATVVALMNNSGADPLAAIETYKSSVLPRL